MVTYYADWKAAWPRMLDTNDAGDGDGVMGWHDVSNMRDISDGSC